MSDATKFAAIFDGLKSAYGTFRIDSKKAKIINAFGVALTLTSTRLITND